ncbi:MAG: class I adenylate cyclase [Cycloclasticus sp.]|nr:class I adenylate cyclase [Cycloclasticus sp.]
MIDPIKAPQRARSLKKIQLISAEGDISKQDLRVVKQRFLNLHKVKMQRALDAVTDRQKIFLELLSLLFHVNHPVLPGYVSGKTPAGIADYTPSKLSIDKAKKLGNGFVYSKRARRTFGIEAIFLMGSVGSIAYAKGSDMDLWLCHAPTLSSKEIELLQEKATEIEKWAMTLGLEAHFFLIDAEKFKAGVATPLSSESSGSTQHHLLLEEFYRTALYVAGRYPVWWLVPPESENNYQAFVDKLLMQRFINRNEVIDFGGLEAVPAEEFLGASLWHLYKAIDSPYKSLLKLMLMELYVDQYPNSDWSALRMKKLIYSGESDPNKLDAYLILYAALEDYFVEKKEPERLNLMRYCFFNKLNENGLVAAKRLKKDWRQEVFSDMLSSWAPLPDYLANALDNQGWDISQVLQEKERLTHELTQSYQLLMKFAKERIEHSRRDNEELTLLGRKLSATLEKRPGKLERSTIKNSRIQQENKVVLKQFSPQDGQSGWVLNRLDINNQERLIRQTPSLIGLLAWCVDYGVLGEKTKIALHPGTSDISSREVAQTLQSVSDFFTTLPKTPTDLEAYRYIPTITNVMLVINSGMDAMSDYTEQGINLISERSDALSFGSQRRNLVLTVDVIFRNSWNEIIVRKYEAMDGLMACLCEIFSYKALGVRQQLPTWDCTSFNSTRAKSVSKRIQSLIVEVASVFKNYSDSVSPRLVIQSARSFYILQVNDRKMTAVAVVEKDLLGVLSEPQPIFSPIQFDGFKEQQDLLPVICKHHQAGLIRIYYHQISEGVAQIYILDEKGSVFSKQRPFASEQTLLNSYKAFLEGTLQRRRLIAYGQDVRELDLEIECYRVEKKQRQWVLKAVSLNDGFSKSGMSVRVANEDQTGELHIYCNEQTFSSLEYGENIYTEAANYIRRKRRATEDYPVYITDIDVSLEELGAVNGIEPQTAHFLQFMQSIEEKLNV